MIKVIQNKYIIYTIVFWAFIIPLICYISSLGLCAVGTSDAISQIYPIMKYTRRLLLNFFNSIWTGDKFVFPMVDYTLGMGDDTIAALNWHGFGDPIYIFTCFVSEQNLPYLYSVLFYFRVYLGGLAFLLFVTELDKNKSVYAYVIGALLYSFTGFTLQSNMHTIFTHAMIYTPLMMFGAERSWKGKKKGILGLSTFFFALSGFYFLYIASVSLAVYVIYRFLTEKIEWKKAVLYIKNMILEYVLGLGAASFIFIPAVIGFLNSDRTGIKKGYEFLKSLPEIWNMLKNMFMPSYNSEQILSVATVGMIIVICIIFDKKKKREHLTLLLLFILTMIPFVSCVMSGFGECYDRWELVINMYFAFLAVTYWDELYKLSKVQRAVIATVFIGLYLIGRAEDIIDQPRYARTLGAYAVLLLMLLFILPAARRFNKKIVLRIAMFMLFAVSCCTICYNWKVVARDKEITVLQERKAVEELLTDVDDETFYRTDNERGFAEPRLGMNISLSQGYPGVMEYVSIENNSYIWVFDKWGISGKDHNVMGLDQRAIFETLSSVKYFVVRSENTSLAPFGFEYVKSTADGEWSLYKNKYALPVIYGYSKVVNSNSFEQMNGLEKQDYMLAAASVENYSGEVSEIELLDNQISETNYEVLDIQDGEIENGIVKVEAGTKLTLRTTRHAGKENYLYLGSQTDIDAEIDIKDVYTKYRRLNLNRFVTLGTVDEDVETEITLVFSQDTEFTLSELKILTYDFSDYEEKISKLRICNGEPVVETNYIHGEVQADESTIVTVAVPYSDGWSAYVDGTKVPTYRINDLFVGFEVSAGTHNVELKYVTPGIRLGIGISLGCILITVCYYIISNLGGIKHDEK